MRCHSVVTYLVSLLCHYSEKNLLIQVGPMTNDDKTSSNFTCVEEQRISEREGVVQVLMCRHAHVSRVNTHLLSLLCASVVNMCWCFT